MTERVSSEIGQLAVGLKMLLLDVDGVLTDGGIILMDQSGEAKRFDVQDGLGVTLAQAAGLKVGIVTGRTSEVVRRRAQELGIDELFQGVSRKSEVLDQILQKQQVSASEIAYIGDDLPDLPIMERIGVPIAVQNAVPRVKEQSVYVTKKCGGRGAVREAVEWLLELRGDQDKAYQAILIGA